MQNHKLSYYNLVSYFIIVTLFLTTQIAIAQFVQVGNGSYTTVFPGVDAAGRNTYPSGSPYTTGYASTVPVPTNDWWSSKIKNNHSDNLFNYPFTMKTVNQGLVVTYIPWGVIDDIMPVTVGVEGLNASSAKVSQFSDWTVTMDWTNGAHNFKATSGIGMPFIYFTKSDSDIAQIKISSGNTSIVDEMIIITDVRNGADFAIYGPTGSTWTQNGNTFTSDLAGNNYWSLAFIPQDASNIQAVANEYKRFAYVFPANTYTTWDYDENTSTIRTDFIVETDVKEGLDSTILMGLLPHQWSNLSNDSPIPNMYSYSTVRGELKTIDGNTFSVSNKFYGILPTLPYLDNYSEGFQPDLLNTKVELLENDGLSTWTDSYNEGQMMNRLIQTARIADLTGDSTALYKILETIKTRLENWLSANAGEVAFIYYYNDTWSSMIGYPAGHGQDGNLNDHHFHWGYFIHAASFVEQFEPGWSDDWGGMIDLLVRDAASSSRDDDMFPFLRNFSPFAGHCWANGFATFPQGNDQESTSESMQFNSSLIHWGSITGNDEIRDLGIYLYTTEQSAIEEYWFDMYDRVFKPDQQYSLVSRVWGNSYDNGTFWTNDIAASYGIEMYPIHGGSLYLGQNTNYVNKLWNEITVNTGILSNEANDNLWHDVMWKYMSFINPEGAIELYDSYPNRSLKFGISDAQTYHWLHAMNVLGNVDTTITANYPIAAVFNKNGEKIYTAHNYQNQPITVSFSDGYTLDVPANKMATSKDISLSGMISSSFQSAYPGGSIDLVVEIQGGVPDKVEFFIDGEKIGEKANPPFEILADNLQSGVLNCYAKIYEGENFNVSNLISIVVGDQLAFIGDYSEIPGSFFAGDYDKFEGGVGQSICYSDVTVNNEGDYRENEYVDASLDFNEGPVVGWIAAGEWIEYTIYVQDAGYYNLDFRYACGNQNGGGPFNIVSDGQVVSQDINVSYTGDWGTWTNKQVTNIPLKSGKQVLQLFFENGELNIGKFTFSFSAPLDYDQPVANAGDNQIIILPQTSGTLNGDNSYDPGGSSLNYKWTQVYGPTQITFSNNEVSNPEISSLAEGVYLFELEVDNGNYFDSDEVYVISSYENNIAPNVNIYNPGTGSEFIEGDSVTIAATASDLVGYVEKVEFMIDNELVATLTQEPYTINWAFDVGDYSLTAKAYDNDGLSSVSQEVIIKITPAPSCYGTAYNGEFDYQFSPDDNNPTLTFIPSIPGVGNPTCILYYGTNANSLPGQYVTPNVPFQLNANEGTKIYFYYTYSYPGQGEHNNSQNKNTYVIGSCKPSTVENVRSETFVKYYPNPVSDILKLEFSSMNNKVIVHRMNGETLLSIDVKGNNYSLEMGDYEPGIYLFKVMNNESVNVFKIIK